MEGLPQNLREKSQSELRAGLGEGTAKQAQGFAHVPVTIRQGTQSVMGKPDAAVPARPADIPLPGSLHGWRRGQFRIPFQRLGEELDRLGVGIVLHCLVAGLLEVIDRLPYCEIASRRLGHFGSLCPVMGKQRVIGFKVV
jgi:hypothetical protein